MCTSAMSIRTLAMPFAATLHACIAERLRSTRLANRSRLCQSHLSPRVFLMSHLPPFEGSLRIPSTCVSRYAPPRSLERIRNMYACMRTCQRSHKRRLLQRQRRERREGHSRRCEWHSGRTTRYQIDRGGDQNDEECGEEGEDYAADPVRRGCLRVCFLVRTHNFEFY